MALGILSNRVLRHWVKGHLILLIISSFANQELTFTENRPSRRWESVRCLLSI